MRFSAVLSALFHAAILVAAMTTFANPDRFFVESPVNIPVELLSLADITNVSAAVVETEEEPEPIEEEVAEEVVPEPPRQVASLPDPVLTLPEEDPEFSPFEEPVPVEAEPEPAPPPAPDLGDVRPSLRPRPPERRRDFFASAADALQDLTPQEEEEPVFVLDDLEIPGQTPEIADEARARVGLGTGLTISQRDALKGDIEACWNPPVGARDAANLQIELRVHFNPDGTVQRTEFMDQIRYNSDGFYRAAADSARRAVERCETGTRFDGSFRRGYDLPRDRYEEWRSVRLTFDPSKML